MSKTITEWCEKAIGKGYFIEDVIEKFKEYPKEMREEVLMKFIQLKGGEEKKMSKRKEFDFDDDEEEEDDEQDEEEEEITPPKKKAGRPAKKVANLVIKDGDDVEWKFFQVPPRYGYMDPITKKIVIEASSMEELNIGLQAMSARNAQNAANQTE